MWALVRTLAGMLLVPLIMRLAALASWLQQHSGGTRRVTRRSFLRNAVLGSVGVVSLQITGGFVYFFWPNKTGAFGGEIAVPASAVPEVGAPPYRNQSGRFYVIHNDDGVLALYWKCPHLGCTVPWDDAADEFHCPCHGSVYDRTGVLIAGPAPRPMDLMPITVLPDQTLLVDTNPNSLIQRSGYSPEQSTRL
ncbi:MAG TPA: Rieske 2Fe-2S domain-containing protein [Thermomicrobiales bacterium]|nr:Rieske 2Fe-2S domain-containing protein [Thermomicrobiales bacterium]